jgi:hypothetical protein
MKRVILIILGILILLALIANILIMQLSKIELIADPVPETNHAIVVDKITGLGKLELVKYQFQDIVDHKLKIEWWPDPQVFLFVYGEAAGCLDFTKIDSSALEFVGDSLLIVNLPEPEICQVKVDHQKSYVYDTRYTMLTEVNLVDEAYRKAEGKILESALQSGIEANTRRQAELMLKPTLEALSQREVELRFPVMKEQDKEKKKQGLQELLGE